MYNCIFIHFDLCALYIFKVKSGYIYIYVYVMYISIFRTIEISIQMYTNVYMCTYKHSLNNIHLRTLVHEMQVHLLTLVHEMKVIYVISIHTNLVSAVK